MIPVGHLTRLGFRKGTTWGTPVQCGAGHGLPFLEEDLPASASLLDFRSLVGLASGRASAPGPRLVEGRVPLQLHYQGLDLVLALAFGTAGAPAQQGGTAAYLHTLTPKKSLVGRFATAAFGKQIDTWEYDSVKVEAIEIQSRPGEGAVMGVHLVGRGPNRNVGSGTNNNTTAATITLPTMGPRVLFSDMAFRVNGEGDAALDDDDLVHVSELTLRIANKLDTGTITTTSHPFVKEPERTAPLDVALELSFSRYASGLEFLIDRGISKAPQKATLTFTGPVAATPYNYSMTFYFPRLVAGETTAQVRGPGRVPQSVPLRGYGRTAAPSGFPAVMTEAACLEVVNLLSADPLA